MFAAANLVHRDGLVGAGVDADAALGAVLRASQNGNVFEVVAARWALVHADAAGGTKLRINDRNSHGRILSTNSPHK